MADYGKTVILAPHGTARREVKLSEVHIPNLWHIARGLGPKAKEAILEVWYIAHDLKKNLADDTEARG